MSASETEAMAADIARRRDALKMLREPFDPTRVGQLPQPYRKDAQKGKCDECGKWHGLPAMHLDFVGHAAVTERLLEVDPEWTWEPFALDEHGLPAIDRYGNLWIRLTVRGVTRIGVGDGASMKVLIGDALRNAAMRFGVALDLWMRGSEDEKKAGDEQLPPAGVRGGPNVSVPDCVMCGVSLAGAEVEKAPGGYAHRGGNCPQVDDGGEAALPAAPAPPSSEAVGDARRDPTAANAGTSA